MGDSLTEYAEHWFRRHSLYALDQRRFLDFNARFINEVEVARPGFSERLRSVARDTIAAGDSTLIPKAVSALATIGTEDDLPALDRIAEGDDRLARDARTAAWEIRHRPA